jgi:hypothetical protein
MNDKVTGLLLALGAVVGCAPAPGLAELGGKTLQLDGVYAGPDTIAVYIWLASAGPCPVALPDLQGTINDAPLVVSNFGMNEPQGTSCAGIRLTGPRPGPGPVAVRVWDSSGTITATFANPFVERTLTLVSPPDGQLFIGDHVTLRYTPASDTFEPVVEGRPIGIGSTSWIAPFSSRAGETASFIVPESFLPITGPTELYLTAKVVVLSETCVGVTRCTAEPGVLVPSLPATIVNDERGNAACYQCACTCADGKTSSFRRDKGVAIRCSAAACMTLCFDQPVPAFSCVARTPEEVSF